MRALAYWVKVSWWRLLGWRYQETCRQPWVHRRSFWVWLGHLLLRLGWMTPRLSHSIQLRAAHADFKRWSKALGLN